MSDAPIAGWYADPEDAASDRWWDGAAWSESRRTHAAADAATPASASSATPAAASPYGVPAYGTQPMFAPATPAQQLTQQVGYAPVISTKPPKNGLALAGLIVAICVLPFSFLGFSFFSFVGGVTAGLISGGGLTRAKRLELAGIPTSRKRMAIAGLVVGYGGAAAALVWTILTIVQFMGNF